MSKKVMIPNDGMNPFVVVHNGEKYVFKPGETVEVSDGVALEIEEYNRVKHPGEVIPPFGVGGGSGEGSGGGNADWNASEGEPGHVENRTHYEETTVVNEPLNITWGHNFNGLTKVDAGGIFFYKVLDDVFTDEQITSMAIKGYSGDDLPDVPIAVLMGDGQVYFEGNITDVDHTVFFVKEDGVTYFGGAVVFPQKGVYVMDHITGITSTEPVEQTKTVVKKLDKKFLPDISLRINRDVDGTLSANISYEELCAGLDNRTLTGGWYWFPEYDNSKHTVAPLFAWNDHRGGYTPCIYLEFGEPDISSNQIAYYCSDGRILDYNPNGK